MNTVAIEIMDNIRKVIKGKDHIIEKVLIATLARGHILIEDVPGVGKTTLARALAQSMDLSYKRVQFTPDLMPSDIIGINIYDKNRGDFSFRKGPIFNHILLADEINRTSPKTQSSLLQAMEEGEVSTDELDFVLDQPFMVLATQNPLEYQGTFPLPEAQLDRFLMRIALGYPARDDEEEILKNYQDISPKALKSVAHKQDVLNMQKAVKDVEVHDHIISYIISITNSTRDSKDIQLGASPRAAIDLLKASKAKAFLDGRDYLIPDDVKEILLPVFAHRLILSPEARMERKTRESILQDLLKSIFVPVI